MTLAELITAIRRKLDDATGFTALDEETIVEALNFAQNEFAVETLCCVGTDNVTVTGGNAYATLATGTISLIHASVAGVGLRKVTQHELDNGHFEIGGVENTTRFSDWRAQTGTPEYVVTDYGPELVRLVPQPTAGSTMVAESYQLPTRMDLEAAPDVPPEIPLAYHEGLVYGALGYLFDIPDLEIYDPNRAVMYTAKWTKYVGAAQIALQTSTRRTERVLDPATGRYFSPPSNTLGVNPSANTEGGNQ